MIAKNFDSDTIRSINRDSEYEVVAQSCQPMDYEDEVYIEVTDTTARYIEKLPEIVELLNELAFQPGRLGTRARIVITYAEGKR